KIVGGDKIDVQNNPNDATIVQQFPKSQYIYRAKLFGSDGQVTNQEIAFGNEWIRTQQQVQPNTQPVNKPQMGGEPPQQGQQASQSESSGSSSSTTSQSSVVGGNTASTPSPSPVPVSPVGASAKKKTIKLSKHQWLILGLRNGWLNEEKIRL
ncbi:MAG: hypothetical protein WC375_10060, partial [Methanomassiliicoccales archaeon]